MFSLSIPLSETALSCDIHALRGSSFGADEKCQTASSHVHPQSGHRSGLSLVAELLKEATLSGRLCERKDDGTAWRRESMNAEGTWYKGTWNDWRWRAPDRWSSSGSSTPQAYSWTWHDWEHHSPWSNQWNSPVDLTSNDPRQHGDGRGEVIPSFDGTDFRQYERPVRLFVSHTRVAPQRRAMLPGQGHLDRYSLRLQS